MVGEEGDSDWLEVIHSAVLLYLQDQRFWAALFNSKCFKVY